MLTLGGGQLTLNLERIHKGIARITSDNVDPGVGGSIDTQLGKDLQRHCKAPTHPMCSMGWQLVGVKRRKHYIYISFVCKTNQL